MRLSSYSITASLPKYPVTVSTHTEKIHLLTRIHAMTVLKSPTHFWKRMARQSNYLCVCVYYCRHQPSLVLQNAPQDHPHLQGSCPTFRWGFHVPVAELACFCYLLNTCNTENILDKLQIILSAKYASSIKEAARHWLHFCCQKLSQN